MVGLSMSSKRKMRGIAIMNQKVMNVPLIKKEPHE